MIKNNHLTIGDLKKIIQDLPEDMLVGRVGHFGEAHFMSKGDFGVKTAYFNQYKDGRVCKNWRGEHRMTERVDVEVFEVSSPDIGETPE